MSADLAASLADGHRARLDKIWATLTARQRRLVAKTLDQIEADLGETRRGSWSAASSSSTLVQLAQSVRGLSTKQLASLRRALPGVAAQAQSDTAAWVRALDESFLGSTTPLAWDSLAWLEQTRDPLMRSRLRIYRKSFQRYGAEAVSAIEDAVAQRVLVGTPWTEAREEVMDIVREQVGGKQWMVDRIVRTESSAVANAVTMAALHAEDDDPGDPMLKKLVATFDAVTGQDSRLLHGQTRPIGQPFLDVRSGREYMAPPNRPNDREIVVGWRRSWGDDREFDEETREAEPVDGETMTQAEIDAMVSEAVEAAAPEEPPTPFESPLGNEVPLTSSKAVKKALEARGITLRGEDSRRLGSKRIPQADAQGWDRVVECELRDLGRLKFAPEIRELSAGVPGGGSFVFGELEPVKSRGFETFPDYAKQRCDLRMNIKASKYASAIQESERESLAAGKVPWSSKTRFTKDDIAAMRVRYKGLKKLDDDSLLSFVVMTRHEYGHGIEFNLEHLAALGDKDAQRVRDMWIRARDEVSDRTFGTGVRRAYTGGDMPPLPEGLKIPANSEARGTWYQISEYATTDHYEMFAETFALASSGKWDHIPEPLHAPMREILSL